MENQLSTLNTVKTVNKPKVVVYYQNKNITSDISRYLQSLTYTDYEKGNSDELEITLKDNHKLFQKNLRPIKGDKISAYIGYSDEELLNCGTFTIDEVSYSFSLSGEEFSIKGLAASINQNIRDKNNKSYKNKTLVQIAKEIANKHGYTVAGRYGFTKISYIAQVNESDIAFLARIAKLYGYIFKLTDKVITFLPEENFTNKKSVRTVKPEDLSSGNIQDSSVQTYASCSVKYLNPKGKLVTYTAKDPNNKAKHKKTNKLTVKCGSKSEAMRVAKAGLLHGTKTIKGTLQFKKGYVNMIAGVNFQLDLGNNYDGKYHITQSTHTISTDEFTTSIEFEG